MMMVNPCKVFGYSSINEEMRAFCVVEMFLAVFNFYIAMCQVPVVDNFFSGYYTGASDDEKVHVGIVFWALFVFLFMFTLTAQAILGFLLYFLGWKKKNVIVCVVWVVFAGINFFWPWIFLLFHICKIGGWPYYQFYLLYTIYGIWIVFCFKKDVKGDTRRVEPSPNKDVDHADAENPPE